LQIASFFVGQIRKHGGGNLFFFFLNFCKFHQPRWKTLSGEKLGAIGSVSPVFEIFG